MRVSAINMRLSINRLHRYIIDNRRTSLLEETKQTRNHNRRILKKLRMIKSLLIPHTETTKTLHTINAMCIQIIRSFRPTIKLFIPVLFLMIITQTHATNPYHTWNRRNMLGDRITPCAHPNSFRITSTNMNGGMFSQLPAASVPTTYEDPPSPIIDSTIRKTKRKMRGKDVNTRFIPAH